MHRPSGYADLAGTRLPRRAGIEEVLAYCRAIRKGELSVEDFDPFRA